MDIFCWQFASSIVSLVVNDDNDDDDDDDDDENDHDCDYDDMTKRRGPRLSDESNFVWRLKLKW